MKKVIIYSLKENGEQQLEVECSLINNVVEISGNDSLKDKLVNDGIKDYNSKVDSFLFPKDGIIFLKQLRYNFRTAYLSATDVIED